MSYRTACLEEKGEQCAICDQTGGIEVHHKDGNRLNNDIKNLLPVCHECHMAIHRGDEGYEKYSALILPEEERAPGRTLHTCVVPDELWKEWKETVPRRLTLNQGLNKLIAREVLEQRGDGVDEETRNRLREIIGQ